MGYAKDRSPILFDVREGRVSMARRSGLDRDARTERRVQRTDGLSTPISPRL